MIDTKRCPFCKGNSFLLRWPWPKGERENHWAAFKSEEGEIDISFHCYSRPYRKRLESGKIYERKGEWYISPDMGASISLWALRRLRNLAREGVKP